MWAALFADTPLPAWLFAAVSSLRGHGRNGGNHSTEVTGTAALIGLCRCGAVSRRAHATVAVCTTVLLPVLCAR